MDTPNSSTPNQTVTPATAAATPASEISWEAIKPWFLGGLAIFALIAVVTGVVLALGEVTEKRIRNEYAQISDDASRTNFAKRYAAHPLGGLVLLGQANSYYAQGNYAAAQSAFAAARNGGLKNEPVLAEQAALGEAFSQYYLDPAKGLPMIEAVASNTSFMENTRAFAAYEIMSKAIFEKNWDRARKYAALLGAQKNASTWQRQLATLREIYPELNVK